MTRSLREIGEDVQVIVSGTVDPQYALGCLLLEAREETAINYGNYTNSNGKPCRSPSQAMRHFFEAYCESVGLVGATIRRFGQVVNKFSIEEVRTLGGMTYAGILSADYVTDEQRQDYIKRAEDGESWTVKELKRQVGVSTDKVVMFTASSPTVESIVASVVSKANGDEELISEVIDSLLNLI